MEHATSSIDFFLSISSCKQFMRRPWARCETSIQMVLNKKEKRKKNIAEICRVKYISRDRIRKTQATELRAVLHR